MIAERMAIAEAPPRRRRIGRPIGSPTLRGECAPLTTIDERTLRSYAIALGRNVKNKREELGIAVQTLARTTGINPTTIHRLEAGLGRGARAISTLYLTTFFKIALALGVSPAELMPL